VCCGEIVDVMLVVVGVGFNVGNDVEDPCITACVGIGADNGGDCDCDCDCDCVGVGVMFGDMNMGS
jgi:hypothetical protein